MYKHNILCASVDNNINNNVHDLFSASVKLESEAGSASMTPQSSSRRLLSPASVGDPREEVGSSAARMVGSSFSQSSSSAATAVDPSQSGGGEGGGVNSSSKPNPEGGLGVYPAGSSGPRIKHVCRKAAVALGKPRATFPPSKKQLRLSALPCQEKAAILKQEEQRKQGERCLPVSVTDAALRSSMELLFPSGNKVYNLTGELSLSVQIQTTLDSSQAKLQFYIYTFQMYTYSLT